MRKDEKILRDICRTKLNKRFDMLVIEMKAVCKNLRDVDTMDIESIVALNAANMHIKIGD